MKIASNIVLLAPGLAMIRDQTSWTEFLVSVKSKTFHCIVFMIKSFHLRSKTSQIL